MLNNNPFDALSNQEQSNIFAYEDNPGVPVSSAISPDQKRWIALMASVAGVDATQDDPTALIAQRAQIYRDQLEQSGDTEIRREAAVRDQSEQLAALRGLMKDAPLLDPSGNLMRGAVAASQQVLLEDIQEREQYALEKQAVDKIQSLAARGDVTQARVLLDNLEMGDANQAIRDIQTKRLILQREIDKVAASKEQQGWMNDAADFVLSMLPLYTSTGQIGNVDIPKAMKKWGDMLFAGKRLNNEADTLWRMNVTDFSNYVEKNLLPNIQESSTLLGYNDLTKRLNILTSMNRTPSALRVNAGNALDNLGLVPIAKPLKGLTSIPGLLVANGARKEASNLLTEAAIRVATEGGEEAATKTGLDVIEIGDNLLPGTMAPEASKVATVPLATDAVAGLERGRRLMDELGDLVQLNRATPEELEKAIGNFQTKLADEVGRELKDINFAVRTDTIASGAKAYGLDLTIGKKEGGGYAREAYARNAARSLGYTDAEIIRDESGQYFFKIQRDLPEQGIYTNVLNQRGANFWTRKFASARAFGDTWLQNFAQVSGNARSRLARAVVDNYRPTLASLRKDETDRLTQVWAAGENVGKWFNSTELQELYQRAFKRDVSQREVDAYNAFVNLNDIDYVLRNEVEAYLPRRNRGLETVSFDTGLGRADRLNAKINRSLDSLPKTRVYNIDEGRHYADGLSNDDLVRLRYEGYVHVDLENAIELSDGTRIKSFVAKTDKLEIEPLRRDQIPYRPGGHRMYRDKYFVKQTVKRQQPDTLKEYLANPNTFISGTKAETEYWASKMERARQVVLNGGTVDDLDAVFRGERGFPTGEEFMRGIDEGVYEKDTPFGSYFDRDNPVEYREIADNDASRWVDDEENGFNGFLRTNGRMYYSKKGEQLKDWQGDKAPTLDLFETTDRAISNVINLAANGNYREMAVARWVENFGGELDVNTFRPDATDFQKFINGKVSPKAPPRIKEAAEGERDKIKRLLNWKTESDLRVENIQREFIEFVNGDSSTGIRNAASRKLVEWWSAGQSPIDTLRGLAFDMKLGLFNIAQLPLQIGTSVAATTISPKYGMGGFISFPFTKGYLTANGTEKYLDVLVERGLPKLMSFDDVKEFKASMRLAKSSGFFDVSDTHGMINSFGPKSVTGRRGVQDVREAGRFAFNMAEEWNRSTAWNIAWHETRQKFPNLAIDSDRFISEVMGQAETFSGMMSRESQAWWQRGILSVPTQFWAYNARMMELMFGPSLTRAQRARLIVGQSVLYGSSGLPLAPIISDFLKDGENPDIESFLGTLDRGLMDRALYEMGAGDVLYGQRVGTGGWLGDTIKDMFGLGEYGEKNMSEVLGGATANILGTTITQTIPVFKYVIAESGAEDMPLTKDALLRLASNITSVSNAMKGYMAHKYGTYWTNTGTLQADGLPTQTAWTIALFGLRPAEADDVGPMMDYLKDDKKAATEAAKVVVRYRNRMLTEPDNRDNLAQEVNAFMRLQPSHLRSRILREANRGTPDSFYDNLAKQVEEAKTKKQLANEEQQ